MPAELVVGLKEGVSQSTEGLERAAVASGGRVHQRSGGKSVADLKATA